jgi:hypothetical protein
MPRVLATTTAVVRGILVSFWLRRRDGTALMLRAAMLKDVWDAHSGG